MMPPAQICFENRTTDPECRRRNRRRGRYRNRYRMQHPNSDYDCDPDSDPDSEHFHALGCATGAWRTVAKRCCQMVAAGTLRQAPSPRGRRTRVPAGSPDPTTQALVREHCNEVLANDRRPPRTIMPRVQEGTLVARGGVLRDPQNWSARHDFRRHRYRLGCARTVPPDTRIPAGPIESVQYEQS
jgi:hypothetical protein